MSLLCPRNNPLPQKVTGAYRHLPCQPAQHPETPRLSLACFSRRFGRRRGPGTRGGGNGRGGRSEDGRRLRWGGRRGTGVGSEKTGFQGDRGEGSGNGGTGAVQPGPRPSRLSRLARVTPRQEAEGRHASPGAGLELRDRAPCPSCPPASRRDAPTIRPLPLRSALPPLRGPGGSPGDLRAQGPQVGEGPPVTSPPARPPRPLQPASRQWPDGAPRRSLRPFWPRPPDSALGAPNGACAAPPDSVRMRRPRAPPFASPTPP